MSFDCEGRAQEFAASLMNDTSHECVIYGQYPETDVCLIVKDAPKTATVFAVVTWADDTQTIHWNVVNDIVALWITLDRFGDPASVKRIQVCESDASEGDLDLSEIESHLKDFSFNLKENDDE